MTLRDYIKSLQDFVKDNPEAEDLEVITANLTTDNGYNSVHNDPLMGHYDGEDFYLSDSEDDINAVCVN